MATNYKAPPILEDEVSYGRWKKELALWEIFTDLPLKKRGAAVSLSLSGKARDIAISIPIEDLQKDDGLKNLTESLDKLFLKDIDQRIYYAYEDFELLKRKHDTSMTEFIIQFEKRNIYRHICN